MKRIILGFLISTSTILFGQDEYSLVDTLSEWYVHHGMIMGSDGLLDPTTDVQGFYGDTLINALSYKKLIINKTYALSLREESKKVIGYGMTNAYYSQDIGTADTEFTLYDFGLEISDTIRYSTNNFSVVTAIDSVLIKDTYRKRLIISKHAGGYDYDEWIDGIGSINGLLYPLINDFELSFDLTCFHYNGELLYANPNYSECIPSDLDVSFSERLKIYPNPFQDYFMISNPGLNSFELKLYNSTGDLVHFGRYNNSNITIVPNIPIGFYTLILIDDSEMIFQKMVKSQ